MKLKSLFLVGLAAMAMASCSNENDPIENGNETGKTAMVQLSMSFPATVATKATEDGDDTEQDFTTLDFYIKYADGTVAPYSYAKTAFTISNGTLVLNETITANAGDGVTYYVILNKANSGISATPTFSETIDGGYTDNMDPLLNNIAKSNGFVMTGSTTGNIVANKINDVTVNVSRVAAKLVENTSATAFTVTGKNASDGAALKMKFENYSFANLNKTANIWGNDPFTTNATYFQAIASTSADLYATWTEYVSKTIAGAESITYCMANAATTPTKIVYQATALWGDETVGKSFYVHDGIAYRSFDLLNAAYTSADLSAAPINLSEASTIAQFAEYGIAKYAEGKCYYVADIKTGSSTSTIVRNNVYKLSVASVASWGLPEVVPPTPQEPTLLTLEVIQDEWTVNENAFAL